MSKYLYHDVSHASGSMTGVNSMLLELPIDVKEVVSVIKYKCEFADIITKHTFKMDITGAGINHGLIDKTLIEVGVDEAANMLLTGGYNGKL